MLNSPSKGDIMNNRRTGIVLVACSAAFWLTQLSAANPVLTPGVFDLITPSSWRFEVGGDSGSTAQGMAIDPSNPSTLYMCWLQQGLFKTTDGGSNWKKIGKVQRDWHNLDTLNGTIRVRVNPRNSNRLYIGEGVTNMMGFWVSDNGGDSVYTPQGWNDFATAQGIFIDDIYDIAVDPSDFNHVLVTSHSAWAWGSATYGDGSGVVESKDGGNTWRVCAMQPSWGAGNNIWFLDNSNSWLLGTQGDGFWRTTDGGNNWTQVTSGYQMCMAHGGGQVYRSKTGVLYGTCFSGIMRSTDYGVTWAVVGPMTFCEAVGSDGNYIYSKQAYNGGAGYYYRTPENDGLTWTAYGQGGSFSAGPFEMAFDATDGILYASTWQDGMLAMKVAGSTSAQNALKEPVRAVSKPSQNKLFVVTADQRGFVQGAGTSNLYDVKGELIGAGKLPHIAMVLKSK